jgi:hypothetical protein
MDASIFSPLVRELLSEDRLCALGPGRPNELVRAKLAGLTVEQLFAPEQVQRQDFAAACLSGLWLYHDFLDESHTLSQDLETAEGSYWHAILHRREPDASNAAYWFRRVGDHPIFEPLTKNAHDLGLQLRSDRWNPFDFIDLCEKHRGSGTTEEMLLRQVQQREWELLFDWCFRRAVGKA